MRKMMVVALAAAPLVAGSVFAFAQTGAAADDPSAISASDIATTDANSPDASAADKLLLRKRLTVGDFSMESENGEQGAAGEAGEGGEGSEAGE